MEDRIVIAFALIGALVLIAIVMFGAYARKRAAFRERMQGRGKSQLRD